MSTQTRPRPGRLFVVSGPSGVGKGSVIAEVLQRRSDLWVSVSTTTRAPREGEVSGKDYEFVTAKEFADEVRAGRFLEWAEYAGNSYGTARAAVDGRLSAGSSVILEIDLEGARQVREADPAAVLVLIVPPDRAELEARLRGRGTESSEQLEQRMAAAERELAAANEFDHVIVNEEISATANDLIQLIEHHLGSTGPDIRK